MQFSSDDSDNLNEQGYIVLEAKNAPTLIVCTLDYLQRLANNFAAGHSLKIGNQNIEPDASQHECEKCHQEEKHNHN
jgi:hypothetical protein